MSMAGRIINIKPLIPDGRFHVNHILRAADVSQDKGHMFRITPELQSQLQFWLVMLRACDGNVRILILMSDPPAGRSISSQMHPVVSSGLTDAARVAALGQSSGLWLVGLCALVLFYL